MNDNPQAVIEAEVKDIIDLERSLEQREAELMQNETFRSFLQWQKDTKEKIELFWETAKNAMIENSIKTVKGTWGSVTVAEKLLFDINEEALPAKFFKKVPDTKKIGDTFRLEGKAPKGATPKYTKYLTKRIK